MRKTSNARFDSYLEACKKIKTAFGYLSDFNTNAVFAAWECGGLFGFDEKGQFWINVAAHMSVAAVLGFKLARRFSSELAAENLTPRDITEALLIHDWNKRWENEYKAAHRRGTVEAIYNNRRIFLSRKNHKLKSLFPEKILRIIVATGDEGIRITEKRPLTLGEEIIFYADCCTSGSVIVRWADRFDALAPEFKPGGRYERANEYYRKRYGVSHRKKHNNLLLPIEVRFARRLGIKPQNNLPLSISPKILHSG